MINTTDQIFKAAVPDPVSKTIMYKSAAAIEYISVKTIYRTRGSAEENRMLVILNGEVNIRHGRSAYKVNKHQAAFLKKNTHIEYDTDNSPADSHTELIIFSPGYDIIKEFSLQTPLHPAASLQTGAAEIFSLQPDLLFFIHSLTGYIGNNLELEESLVKIKLLEFLYCLKNSHINILSHLLDFRKEFRPNIKMVAEENYMNPLSVAQLARLAGRSLSSFRRDFISVYNMPPSQWIRNQRLIKSREFLLNTNMSVTDICYTLGFENIAHFSRLFKSHYGHSPTDYRQQLLSA